MDKLEEYIPLLVIGLIYIASYFRKSKKKREQEHANTNLPKSVRKDPILTQKKSGNNESENKPFVRPIAKETVRKEQSTQPRLPEPWSFDKEIISSLESHGEQNTYVNQSLQSDFDAEISTSDIKNVEGNVAPPMIIDIKDYDELRKAVIYSEILQRKYS